MVPLVVKLKHQDRVTFKAGILLIDYIGALLFTGGLVAFLLGLSWGGIQFSWTSYQTLVPMILGAVVTIVSLIWVARFAKLPFIKLSIYKNYSAIAALGAAFLQGYTVSLIRFVRSILKLTRSPVVCCCKCILSSLLSIQVRQMLTAPSSGRGTYIIKVCWARALSAQA